MPHAQAFEFGLDWDTEINSFWSWFMDARDVLEDGVDSSSLVRKLVEQQRDAIERAAKREKRPQDARLVLRVAVALVGLQYASNQKLLRALREEGLFTPVAKAPQPEEAPTF
jgi:hypothetical protein